MDREVEDMSRSEIIDWKKLGEAVKRQYIVKWDKCDVCGRYAETVLVGGLRVCGSNKCFLKLIMLLTGNIKRWYDAFH